MFLNTDDFNKLIKPLADEWVDDLVKYGLINKDETNTMLEQKNMTNRPNLTEEEKEHYNKVAMDMIHNKTPRTDKAEPQIRFIKSGWVRSDFARELELELNALSVKNQKLCEILERAIDTLEHAEICYLVAGGRILRSEFNQLIKLTS